MHLEDLLQCFNKIFADNDKKVILTTDIAPNPKYPVYRATSLKILEDQSFDSGTDMRIERAMFEIYAEDETSVYGDKEFMSAVEILETTGTGYQDRLDTLNGTWRALNLDQNIKFISIDVPSKETALEPSIQNAVTSHVSTVTIMVKYSVKWSRR